MGKLDGKVALITGGNSGIGLAAARLFMEEGARIVLAARGEERGREAAESLVRTGGQAIFAPCDLRRSADCQRLVELAIETYGRLDILFNNAGVIHIDRSVVTTSEEEWDETMDVNVKGIFLMSRAAIPWMRKNQGGAIVNTASIFGLVGGSGAAAYCASKGAVILLTKAMALDHAGENIRVNCVCPGSVDTPMLQGEMDTLGGVEKMRASFAARHPLNRIATPEEIARAVLYLASDDSSFVTGIALPVDGGRSAW
ncbi:MAG: SDR family NAD(P)-dependent oxidoreductase [Rectinemataceae bacterium]